VNGDSARKTDEGGGCVSGPTWCIWQYGHGMSKAEEGGVLENMEARGAVPKTTGARGPS